MKSIDFLTTSIAGFCIAIVEAFSSKMVKTPTAARGRIIIFCVLAMGIKSRVCYWQFLKPSILLSCNVVDVVKPWIIRYSCPWICCECWQSWSIGHCGKTDFSSMFVNVGLWHSGKVFREMDSGIFKSIKSESWRRDPSVFMSEMVCQWNGSTWSSVRPDSSMLSTAL